MASIATLALKSAEWFLRGLLLMVILLSRALSPRSSSRVSTYRSVQISGATSDIADYIVGFYNSVRLHSKRGNLPPNAFEQKSAIKQPIVVSEKT